MAIKHKGSYGAFEIQCKICKFKNKVYPPNRPNYEYKPSSGEYFYKQDELDIDAKIHHDEATIIKYSLIAKSFLKYYWHQICKWWYAYYCTL